MYLCIFYIHNFIYNLHNQLAVILHNGDEPIFGIDRRLEKLIKGQIENLQMHADVIHKQDVQGINCCDCQCGEGNTKSHIEMLDGGG